MSRHVKRITRRLRDSAPAKDQRAHRGPRPASVHGLVEIFDETEVRGWVSVPASAAPVRVRLRVNDLDVASTYATAVPAVDESGPASGAVTATGRIHDVPDRLQRNSWRQIRPFYLRLDDLWQYTRTTAKVSVRIDGVALPIYGHGMYVSPSHNGTKPLPELRAKLASGHVFSQYGRLQLSRKLDADWQRREMGLYERVRAVIEAEFGHDIFLVYGTLLGAVREGGFISHDIDLDTAFVSDLTDGPGAAAQLQQIGLRLVEHGMDATTMYTAIHVRDPEDPEVRLDVFHLYFDDAGVLRFPFGIAGTSRLSRTDWQGTEPMDFAGARPLVPVNAEAFVEHLYGADWRTPKPGFNWALERTERAAEGEVPQPLRAQAYWTNFYAHHDPVGGSTFFQFVNSRPDTPARIIDIGCGNGRDSLSFAAAGRYVTGLDISAVGLDHASERAASMQLSDHVSFRQADVSDAQALRTVLTDAVSGDGPVLFYLRFFLHAIPAAVQRTLLSVMAEVARDGDMFAAEFRTKGDQDRAKEHRTHYRHYENGPAFGRRLRDRHGFELRFEVEGTGLAPYKNEDPVLYRVLAVRNRVSGSAG